MQLNHIFVRPVLHTEEEQFKDLMTAHHYLGFCPKIGETAWYVAVYEDHWIALISFSVSALKSEARDKWIGWSHRNQFGRLKLVVNNNRFLILPDYHFKNMASRVISQCLKRLNSDWLDLFGHEILLVETFVDPNRFQGTVYKASNWHYIGNTRGFKRAKKAYLCVSSPKMIFVKVLRKDARKVLSHSILDKTFQIGTPKMTLAVEHMRSLPDFFKNLPDPRRSQGQRHQLHTILALAAGAVLCGMIGYKAISDWVNGPGQKARIRFACYYQNGKYIVPGESTIRRALISVDPDELEKALQCWNDTYSIQDESLAIDGKVMRNAIDSDGNQTHILGVVGYNTLISYGKKNWNHPNK